MVERYLLISGGQVLAAAEWNDEWQEEVDDGDLDVFEYRDGHFWVRRAFERGQPMWERV